MAEKRSYQLGMEFAIVIDCEYGNFFQKHIGDSHKR